MLCCCGPKSKGQGGGLHRAAAVLAILSTICYLVGAILCVVAIIRINADPANAFRRPCTSLPCPFASCSSRCEMLFDDLENSFGYDDGEAAKRWYESGGSVGRLVLSRSRNSDRPSQTR